MYMFGESASELDLSKWRGEGNGTLQGEGSWRSSYELMQLLLERMAGLSCWTDLWWDVNICGTLPKLVTSNTLTVLSLLALTNIEPSALTATPVTGPKWPLYCFTNSIPTACFFQNLTTPSTEVVIRKSVCGVTVTNDNVSRCMYDLVYRTVDGSLSRYAFSCGSTYKVNNVQKALGTFSLLFGTIIMRYRSYIFIVV